MFRRRLPACSRRPSLPVACGLVWVLAIALPQAQAQAQASSPALPQAQPSVAEPLRFVAVCLSGTTACSPVVAVRAMEHGWALPAQVARELGVANAQPLPQDAQQVLVPFDQARWDDTQLTLTWEVPASQRAAQSLTHPPLQVLPDRLVQGLSAQVGYTVGLDTAGHATAGASLTAGKGNTWLSASGFAYGSRFQPGLAQVVHLRPAQAQRWVLGEQVVSAADPLGGGALLRGVSVRRDFSLQPDRFIRPLPAVSGVFEQPGVVEIYRNGVLVETTPVAPGPYDWGRLPLGEGAQDLDVVFRAADGSRQSLASPGFFGQPDALGDGVIDYALDLGQDPAGETAWQGWVRRGLPRAWTLGARTEGAGAQRNAGIQAQASAGPWGMSLAASADHAGRQGRFAQVEFARGALYAQAFSLRTDPGYWRLGYDTRTQLGPGGAERASRGVAASLSRGSASLSLQASIRQFEQGPAQQQVLATASWATPGRWRWTLQSQLRSGAFSDRSLSLSLAVPLGPRQSLSAQVQAGTRPSQSAQYTRTHDGAFGDSLAGFARHDDTGHTLGMRASRDTHAGTARLEATTGSPGTFAQATFSGSLNAAAGQWRAGSARAGGAVLIQVKGQPQARVEVNHQDMGLAGPNGLLVDGLAPNTPIVISLDPATLPLSADLSRASMQFLSSGLGVARVELDPVPAPATSVQVWLAAPDGSWALAHRGILVLGGQRYLVGTTGNAWLPADAPRTDPATLEGHGAPMPCQRQQIPEQWRCAPVVSP